ncbi:MAG: ComEC/Rec2 family competence protein [Chlamydiia bacterium]|nr:ComEC/Rec2 family competence protein [Chlamydiia bacterium]
MKKFCKIFLYISFVWLVFFIIIDLIGIEALIYKIGKRSVIFYNGSIIDSCINHGATRVMLKFSRQQGYILGFYGKVFNFNNQRILEKFPSIFSALMLNSKNIYFEYANSIGLSYLFSVSGLHFSIVNDLVVFLNKNKTIENINVILMVLYMIIVGISPAVFRAFIHALVKRRMSGRGVTTSCVDGCLKSTKLSLCIFPIWIKSLGMFYSFVCSLSVSIVIDVFRRENIHTKYLPIAMAIFVFISSIFVQFTVCDYIYPYSIVSGYVLWGSSLIVVILDTAVYLVSGIFSLSEGIVSSDTVMYYARCYSIVCGKAWFVDRAYRELFVMSYCCILCLIYYRIFLRGNNGKNLGNI